MIWNILHDYDIVYTMGRGITGAIVMDPLLVVYAAIAIAIIYFFFKKDPLELFSKQNERQQEEKLQAVIAEKSLTKREAEVLELVCSGMNNPSIAETLCISENTVKRHLNNIFQRQRFVIDTN